MRPLVKTYVDYGEKSRIFSGERNTKYSERILNYMKTRETQFYVRKFFISRII